MRCRRGFTIVELMIVVAILGVLAAIAVPVYNGYVRDSERSEALADLQTLRLLLEQRFVDEGEYPANADMETAAELDAEFPAFNPKKNGVGTIITAYKYKVVKTTVGGRDTGFTITATHRSDATDTVTLTHDNKLTVSNP